MRGADRAYERAPVRPAPRRARGRDDDGCAAPSASTRSLQFLGAAFAAIRQRDGERRQRRLQPVRQIGDVTARAFEVCGVLLQQRVEFRHQRADLKRLSAGHARCARPARRQRLRAIVRADAVPAGPAVRWRGSAPAPSTASEIASVVIASRNGPITAARGAEAMIVTASMPPIADATRKCRGFRLGRTVGRAWPFALRRTSRAEAAAEVVRRRAAAEGPARRDCTPKRTRAQRILAAR